MIDGRLLRPGPAHLPRPSAPSALAGGEGLTRQVTACPPRPRAPPGPPGPPPRRGEEKGDNLAFRLLPFWREIGPRPGDLAAPCPPCFPASKGQVRGRGAGWVGGGELCGHVYSHSGSRPAATKLPRRLLWSASPGYGRPSLPQCHNKMKSHRQRAFLMSPSHTPPTQPLIS